ncbi:MAG: T9SS type A sorting domain-containing protein, partial [Cytophagales bacterium]
AITNVPSSQSVGKIIVTGNSTYSFSRASGSSTITLTSLTGNALQIDNGSTLAIGATVPVNVPVNINLPSGGTAEIGGQLNLINGNLDASNATLLIHTNSAPLATTSGQVSMNAGSTLLIGNAAHQTGATITLPNGIFVSAPTISSLTINRTNGAALGNQQLTITTAATFTLGNLTTNGSGRIRFGASAANPVETSNSHIIGYAEMLSRAVGTSALDFLGFSMSSGGDVGAVSLVRRTGTAGTNNFNSNQSIAASWDVTPDEPTVSRNVRFRWVSSFDNSTDPAKKFQVYRFSSGPGWTEVGSLQNLTATSPLRETVIVSVNSIDDTFTVTDETQVLPVELVSFSASSSNGVVQLFWKTASELNNESFTIERSRAGEKFEDVQTIKGMGTTPTATNYTAQDVTPYTGISYYRLRQKDFDGRTSYSNVVSVSVSDTGGWSVLPNPSDGSFFTIKLWEKEIGKSAAVELRNNAGQLVSSFRSVVDDRSEIAFKISQPLLSGFYITSVMIDGGMIRLKLIVQ